MESLRRRVVITGLGIVCPIGNTAPAAWSALIAGKSGAGPISQFDTDGFPVRFACEVNDFDPSDFIDQKAARRMDRCTHLVVAAARQAQEDAQLNVAAVSERTGTAIGTALGGVRSFEQTVLQLTNRGPDRVSPFSIVQTLPNLPAGWVSIELGT